MINVHHTVQRKIMLVNFSFLLISCTNNFTHSESSCNYTIDTYKINWDYLYSTIALYLFQLYAIVNCDKNKNQWEKSGITFMLQSIHRSSSNSEQNLKKIHLDYDYERKSKSQAKKNLTKQEVGVLYIVRFNYFSYFKLQQ